MSKESVPSVGFIKLEDDKIDWGVISDKEEKEISTIGSFEIEPKRKFEIDLVITKVSKSGKKSFYEPIIGVEAEDKIAIDVLVILRFLNNYLKDDCWIMKGYLKNEKDISITILHFSNINKTIYSLNGMNKKIYAYLNTYVN